MGALRIIMVLPVAGLALAATPVLASPAAVARPAAVMTYHATLSGDEEVPTKGSGSGTATITVDAAAKQVCYDITTDVPNPIAAHLHIGPKGTAGNIVVKFAQYPQATKGCDGPEPGFDVNAINQNPAGFYVNVHSPVYPNGAARGNLTK